MRLSWALIYWHHYVPVDSKLGTTVQSRRLKKFVGKLKHRLTEQEDSEHAHHARHNQTRVLVDHVQFEQQIVKRRHRDGTRKYHSGEHQYHDGPFAFELVFGQRKAGQQREFD